MFSLNQNCTLKYIVLGLFAAIYGLVFVHNLQAQNFGWYNYTEWFVNYSGGFIRRGLAGQGLLFLAQNHLITPFRAAFALGYLGIFTVAAFYVGQLIGNLRRLTVLSLVTLLFLPTLVFFLPTIPGKKEIFGFLLVVFNLKLVSYCFPQFKKRNIIKLNTEGSDNVNWQKAERQYLTWVFIVFNVFAVLLILNHEAIFFLYMPTNIAIAYTVFSVYRSSREALIKAVLVYTPTYITFLLCFLGKGDATTTAAICESWKALGLLDCDASSGSWLFIGHSWASHIFHFKKHVIEHRSFLFYSIAGMVNLFFLICASASTVCNSPHLSGAHAELKQQYLNRLLTKYLWLPLLASAPLYPLGWDWGRWLSAILLSYAFCVLSSPLLQLEWAAVNRLQPSRDRPPLRTLWSTVCHHWESRLAHLTQLPQQYPRLYTLSLVYVVLFTSVPFFEMKLNNLHTGLIHHLIGIFS